MTSYADSELTYPEIARELNVEVLMEGSVFSAGNRVRVTVQLIDVATFRNLWSESYDRELVSISDIESDIAVNVANALGTEKSLEERQAIDAP